MNREPNNGRGPVDFKVSAGAHDKALIEFKLAKSPALKRNLKNQVEIYAKANATDKVVKVVIAYTRQEAAKVEKAFQSLDKELDLKAGATARSVVVIDARSDNKPSASKA